MADFKIVRKTEREFKQGYTLVEGEIGQEIDTERIKAGPGVWANLPYLVDGPIDLNTLQAALALHLAQTDPHLDRQYTNQALGGVGAGTPIGALADDDTISTSAGTITASNLAADLVTDDRVAALNTVATLVTQQAVNAAGIAALSNQSTILGVHDLKTAVAAPAVVQNDLFASRAINCFKNTVLLYQLDEMLINTSGADVTWTRLMKMAGNNDLSFTCTLPSTAAGQVYQSTLYLMHMFGADSLHHWHRVRWEVWPQGTTGTGFVTGPLSVAGDNRGDMRGGRNFSGTDWGVGTVANSSVVPAVESRMTPSVLSNAGISYQHMGSSLVLNVAP